MQTPTTQDYNQRVEDWCSRRAAAAQQEAAAAAAAAAAMQQLADSASLQGLDPAAGAAGWWEPPVPRDCPAFAVLAEGENPWAAGQESQVRREGGRSVPRVCAVL